MFQLSLKLGALFVIIMSGSSLSYIYWVRRRKKHLENRCQRTTDHYNHIPTVWKQIGTVSEINLFPLKSGYYLRVTEAFCNFKGLEELQSSDRFSLSDRCFLVYRRDSSDNDATYISNISYNQLVRVQVKALDKDNVEFSVHNNQTILPLLLNINDINNSVTARTKVKMYEKDTVEAVDCGEAASMWLSTYLTGRSDPSIRLGVDCQMQRKLNDTIYEKYREMYGNTMTNEDMGKYAYLASYMIMNTKSVQDLNHRLREKGEEEVSIQNFRGNIIICTDLPYSEDNHLWVRINDAVTLRVMKPCTRCTMTCLDPQTGRKNPNLEPLRTLRAYRSILKGEAKIVEKNGPVLGQYCGLYTTGIVKVGDPVYVENQSE